MLRLTCFPHFVSQGPADLEELVCNEGGALLTSAGLAGVSYWSQCCLQLQKETLSL